MRPGRHNAGPPRHVARPANRLPAYERSDRRAEGHHIDAELAAATMAISAASLSLASYMYGEILRDPSMPEANPLNESE